MRRLLFFSPANMNVMSGSAVWTQSTAEVLGHLSDSEVTVLLKAPILRSLLTEPLYAIRNLKVIDPRDQDRYVPNIGLSNEAAFDIVERLDRSQRYDGVIVRGFSASISAMRRGRYLNRLWSVYPLEPERDIFDLGYQDELRRLASHSRYMLVQSEPMRAILEGHVPEARGKTLLLPPAVPGRSHLGVLPREQGKTTRLVYAGKYHPFYCVPELIEQFSTLRASHPELQFHLFGDQLDASPEFADWVSRLQRLAGAPGVEWHGAVARHELAEELERGGIGLSIWDHRHGSAMNDLVVSTKLLDYCNAGLAVVLTRTPMQEEILGDDYPLFVDSVDEVQPIISRLLEDPDLLQEASRRCRLSAARFSYQAVADQLSRSIAPDPISVATLAVRPKLPGAPRRVGIPLQRLEEREIEVLARLFTPVLSGEPAAHLTVGLRAMHALGDPRSGEDPCGRFRAFLAPELLSRVTFQTVTDPLNWWRGFGLYLAPQGCTVDADSLAIGKASGARQLDAPGA